MYTAKVERGSTCVVFGAGMVGLGAVAGCRLQGAERIVCVDLSPERLEWRATRAPPTRSWVGRRRRRRSSR
jgi:S-(hydroxymethyl)glutathione dehydrogenase/alcohol dehydrogenase